MPGKVLQSMNQGRHRNPLFLLDEIDKLGMDFRGDPSSSALLEVLDPEQNTRSATTTSRSTSTCRDVMFIATANSMNIPPPLLDRMEVIRLSGYTEDEKVNIASRYLLPKQMREQRRETRVESRSPRAPSEASSSATHARGGRAFARARARSKICRKVVKIAKGKQVRRRRHADNLNDFLGVRKFAFGRREAEPGRPGGRPRVDRGRRRSADHRGW